MCTIFRKLTKKNKNCGGQGLNPGPCIFYALSIPIELSSRGQLFVIRESAQKKRNLLQKKLITDNCLLLEKDNILNLLKR